mgnify:CR=1 FL=1
MKSGMYGSAYATNMEDINVSACNISYAKTPCISYATYPRKLFFLCASYEINKYLQVLKRFSSHCSIWLVCYILPDLLHQYLWRIVQVEFYAVKGTRTHSVCNVKMLEWIFTAQHNLTASFLWYSKNICMCCTKFKWHLCTICHPT